MASPVRVALVTLAGALVLSGCSSEELPRLGMPNPSPTKVLGSCSSGRPRGLAALIIGGIVWGMIIWAAIVYRRRHADDPLPKQTRYNLPIEVFYTVVPPIISAASHAACQSSRIRGPWLVTGSGMPRRGSSSDEQPESTSAPASVTSATRTGDATRRRARSVDARTEPNGRKAAFPPFPQRCARDRSKPGAAVLTTPRAAVVNARTPYSSTRSRHPVGLSPEWVSPFSRATTYVDRG